MRIVFAGTPDFAAMALGAILDVAPARGWTVPLVLTQPDRPSGRGMKLSPSPVKVLAVEHGIELDTPVSLRKGDDAAAALSRLRAVEPDVMVVAAYGLILPEPVLAVPQKYGAINIHASLLPRWRGAAPVARAIEAGDGETGITIMQMDTGLDTGAMLLTEPKPIAFDATTATLTRQLAVLGARLIVRALTEIERLTPQPQSAIGATYASKLAKSEAWLNWESPAVHLARQVRAFDPFPVASSLLDGQAIRVWRAEALPTPSEAAPGTVLGADSDGVRIACGVGQLRLHELQRPGGKRITAREFAAGRNLTGQRLAGPDSIDD
jgi:methionyl-tRNA formyltransferase